MSARGTASLAVGLVGAVHTSLQVTVASALLGVEGGGREDKSRQCRQR